MNGESKNDASDFEDEIAQAILIYLLEHPDAKDTLEGIAQWWLLKQCSERRVADVQCAVSFLLSKDLIIETRREGSPPHYGINRSKEKEIAEVLKRK